MVSFHTYGWIQQCVESFLRLFPFHHILVVDNNPRQGEGVGEVYRADDPGFQFHKTYRKDDGSLLLNGKVVNKAEWNVQCEQERSWLQRHPKVILIEPPKRLLPHGQAIDFALQWHRSNGVRIMLYFEPDCVIDGSGWYDNLLEPMRHQAWLAHADQYDIGAATVCPSMWRVEKVRHTFDRVPYEEVRLPLFKERVHPELSGHVKTWTHWTTGGKNWFEFLKVGKVAKVESPGFRHLWDGTLLKKKSSVGLL